MMWIILGDGLTANEKLAKDKFSSSSCEEMHGQLDHEIAKGFRMFYRKCFPVKTQCQTNKEYVEYNSPIPRDLHLGHMSAKKLNVLVFVVQQWDDQTPGLWTFLDLEEVLLKSFQIFRCRRRWRRRVSLLNQLRQAMRRVLKDGR